MRLYKNYRIIIFVVFVLCLTAWIILNIITLYNCSYVAFAEDGSASADNGSEAKIIEKKRSKLF
jgi:uncharacterized membrane protein